MARSFPLVARLLTRRGRRRQALLLVVLPILAGCGGGGHSNASTPRIVAGPGFRFAVPDGWKVSRTRNGVTVAAADRLVEVSTFPLQRRYTDALFTAVESELKARMGMLARASGGTVVPGKTVRVAGIRSHSYRVASDGMIDEYVFVLRGTREYQLLCRRKASDPEDPCRLLVTSFRVV
jgi:hypothetical protein